MTRSRNRSLSLAVPFVAILIAVIAAVALAQMQGAGQPFGRTNTVSVLPLAPVPSEAELPSIAGTDDGRFHPVDRPHTKRQDAAPGILTTPSFAAVVTYDLGGRGPVSMAVADLNLDGKLDVVVANVGGNPVPSSVSVLLGNGDGTFQPSVNYDFGPIGPVSVAVADVNVDGKPDLVIAHPASGTVGIFLGNGDGTFQPVITFCCFAGNPIALADVNGDGKPDLVMVSATLIVELGNGDATFQAPVSYDTGGESPNGVAIADVNGDGKPDLLVTNYYSLDGGMGNVGVLLGKGDGTFQTVVTYETGGSGPHSPVVADVNGDGKPDLVVANSGSGTVGVLLGNGDGTFQPAIISTDGSGSLSIAVADVNGDGLPDVLVSNGDAIGGLVYVLPGKGDGTFQSPMPYASGGEFPNEVGIADVNHDGKADLLVVNGTTPSGVGNVGVLLNNTGAPPSTTTLVSNLNPIPFWKRVTYTATVTAQHGGPVTGSVIFHDVADTNVPLVNNQASYSIAYGLRAGQQRVITATYSGDLHNQSSTSAPLVEYIETVASNTVVTSSGSPSILGQPVTFTAKVTSSKGPIPDGELVTFYDGLNPIGTGTTALGVATFSTSSLSAKIHYMKATYTGDRLFEPSTGIVTQVVNRYSTACSLESSKNPSVYGDAVTFTATVTSASGTPPNGEIVTFKNGSAVLGTGALSGGIASLTTSSLPAGIFTITASYPGDPNFAASTSPGLRQVVNSTTKSATSTTFISSLNPSVYGQRVTFTATVKTAGSIPPTGTVVFTWRYFTETYTIGSATLNSNGVATLTKSNLNVDSYPLTAVYKGDTNNLGSTSPVVNQVVKQTTSSATLTSSPNPSIVGQAVTFTAKITSPTVTPTGPVTFTAGTTVLGTAQLSGGKATFTTSSLPRGSTVVKVTYYGDSNIAKSSASVTQVVQP